MTWPFIVALLTGAPSEETLQAAQKRLTEATVSLTFASHQTGKSGNCAASHLLIGNDSALLIDAQQSERDSKKIVEMIKATGKKLEAVLVTSARAEHFAGLRFITAEFPQAKVWAPKAIAAEVGATALSASTLPFDGEKLAIIPLGRGDGDSAIAVYVPVLQVLVAGDLVWSGDALIPDEERALGKKAWKKRLAKIEKDYKIATVLPGHGDPGTAALFQDMKKRLAQ